MPKVGKSFLDSPLNQNIQLFHYENMFHLHTLPADNFFY
jgi:hypothetical protein